MKRIVMILVSLALILSLAAPALADEDTEASLTAVTERVVGVLDVADDFTDFSGSYNSGPVPSWDLYWSKDTESLSVRVTEDGVITEVYDWTYEENYNRFYGFDAAFPRLPEEEARQQAEYWLGRLAGENERARIDSVYVPLSANGEYSFSGLIMINGLESPISFNIHIAERGLVSYDRSDSYRGYVGEIPQARARVSSAQAEPLLKDAVDLELYYVSDGDEARLRYVPVGDRYVVDAQTGEAVNMDELYASFGGGYFGPEAPMAMAMSAENAAGDADYGRALTETELSSIENYADAMTQEELDASVRAVGELGLGEFDMTRCSYSMDSDGNITATLRYVCEMTEDNLFGYSQTDYWDSLSWGETPRAVKNITVNAKTGTLESVYTSYSLWDRDYASTADVGTADSFIDAVAPEMAADSALCTLKGYNEDAESFTYARMYDGFFFPENYLYVGVNAATGTVDDYYYVWDEDAVFAPYDGILDEAGALDAYTSALDVKLGYTAWPEEIDYDDPVLYAYADWGYSYVESLRLAYYYSGLGEVAGIDALTGEPVRQSMNGGFVYDDLDGVPEREAIEALAEAGIGFRGSAFLPEKELTMRDAAWLLLSADGYDPGGWDDDMLGEEAAWTGFITASEWEPDQVLETEAFVRMILSASRYGDAASLPGVGYETIAAALGMIGGEMPAGVCTRADAAVLLYRFMMRG